MCKKDYSAKEYSVLIENLLKNISICPHGTSDEILLDPYEVIISKLEYRIPQEKLEKFKLAYQGVSGQRLQALIDSNYDVNHLLTDLRQLIKNN